MQKIKIQKPQHTLYYNTTMSALTHSDNSFLPPPLAPWSLAGLGGNGAFPPHIITTPNSTRGILQLEESKRIQSQQQNQQTNTIDLTCDDVPYYFPDSDLDSDWDSDWGRGCACPLVDRLRLTGTIPTDTAAVIWVWGCSETANGVC